MKIEIVNAKRYHCGHMARLMRVEHHAALLRMQVPIHREIRRTFDLSFYRRSAFLDGDLAAMWGLEGSMLSSAARVWLVLSQHVLKHPTLILRHAAREIERMAATRSELVTTVIPDDDAAHRLVAFLGFESPDGFGGGRARNRSGRNNLIRYFRNNPDLMVHAGPMPQIGVVYRKEA